MGRGLQVAAYNSISNKGIGNEGQVQEYLEEFDEDDLKKAIEESLILEKEAEKEKKLNDFDNKAENNIANAPLSGNLDPSVKKKNIDNIDLLGEGFGAEETLKKKEKNSGKENQYPDLLKFDDDDEEEKRSY